MTTRYTWSTTGEKTLRLLGTLTASGGLGSVVNCTGSSNAGIVSSQANFILVMFNVHVTQCKSTGSNNGGFISMNTGQGLTLSNTHFSENEARRQGGAVYSRAPTEIHNSLFEDNGAERFGGAVYLSPVSTGFLVQDSSFEGNWLSRSNANKGGTGVYGTISANQNQVLRATNCSFLKNFLTGSTSSGGQLWMRTSTQETSEATGTVSYVTNRTFYSEITFFGDASLVVENMYNSIISWNYATGTHRNGILSVADTKYATLEWNLFDLTEATTAQMSMISADC